MDKKHVLKHKFANTGTGLGQRDKSLRLFYFSHKKNAFINPAMTCNEGDGAAFARCNALEVELQLFRHREPNTSTVWDVKVKKTRNFNAGDGSRNQAKSAQK